jgi:hypothetical protein
MFRLPFLLSAFLILLLSSACYEDNIACLDADATNFDILADEACPDCCVYPTFSLDVDRIWGDTTLLIDNTYQDGAGNDFRLIRFRVYLSELGLVAGGTELPTPENEVEVGVISGADTVLTNVNANLALVSATSATTSTVGRLRVGTEPLTQLLGTFGLGDAFTAVYPPSAPAASPLSTQVGLLNFNDGAGYLTASAEYVLTASDDTVRIDTRGLQSLSLDFPGPLEPLRGVNLTLELEADYQRIFGTIDLTEPEATVAEGISARVRDWLQVVGVR